MTRIIPYILIILLILSAPSCFSQSAARVSDPRLEVRDNTIHISYDILNGVPGEKYVISIKVRNDKGNALPASSLKGDIGMVEDAGVNKVIIWDPGADHVFIDSEIFIKVNCEIVLPLPPAVTPAEDSLMIDQPGTAPGQYTLTGVMLRSLALPGLGLNRITGKPHWLKGVAGYACLAGSVVMNRVALNTYDGIEALEEFEDKDELYQDALTQNKISQALAYSAAVIWVSDLVWTLVEGSKQHNLSLGSEIDPFSNMPLLCFRYSF